MTPKDALLKTLERRRASLERLAGSDELHPDQRQALAQQADGVRQAMADVAAAAELEPASAPEGQGRLAACADALKPFAELGAWMSGSDKPDDTVAVDFGSFNTARFTLTLGDFRAATAALARSAPDAGARRRPESAGAPWPALPRTPDLAGATTEELAYRLEQGDDPDARAEAARRLRHQEDAIRQTDARFAAMQETVLRQERLGAALHVASLPQPEDGDPAWEAGYAAALGDAVTTLRGRDGRGPVDWGLETALGTVLREIDNAIAYCEGIQTPAILGASKAAYDGAQTTKRALIAAQDDLLQAMEVRGLGVAEHAATDPAQETA